MFLIYLLHTDTKSVSSPPFEEFFYHSLSYASSPPFQLLSSWCRQLLWNTACRQRGASLHSPPEEQGSGCFQTATRMCRTAEKHSQYHWMNRGIIALEEKNRHNVVWNNERIEPSASVLLLQIIQRFLKNVHHLGHFVTPFSQSGAQCCPAAATVYLYHTDMWTLLTFLWKVPSKAATMIVFPKLAISSQNSTASGNCNMKEAKSI